MLRNRSIATIDAPEFINLEKDAINPGISKCEVKVFYLGKNRNGSYIDRNAAIQMANSLPGTPIVGAYRKDVEDFGDHGDVIHIENGEIEFSCSTVPYGFVAPDAEVWFQKFTDIDEFENKIEREYLMTTAYLWTGQYPEVEKCLLEGQGQSMELDGEKMEGHWATDNNTGIDFFIINDAIFTKLCILGDDVEPCFEGAAITNPDVSKNFAYRESFSHTLFSMMNELKGILENKGGSNMSAIEETQVEETFTEEPAVEVEPIVEEGNDAAEDSFAKDKKKSKCAVDDKKEEEDETSDPEPAEEDPEEKKDDDKSACGPRKKKTKSSLEEEDGEVDLQEQFADLQSQFAALQEELTALRNFKLERDNADKDALINKYHMLSDEDKAEIVENKAKYSLAEIESKLALIYVQKNVDFESVDGKQGSEEESPITTFSLEDEAGVADSFMEALRNTDVI